MSLNQFTREPVILDSFFIYFTRRVSASLFFVNVFVIFVCLSLSLVSLLHFTHSSHQLLIWKQTLEYETLLFSKSFFCCCRFSLRHEFFLLRKALPRFLRIQEKFTVFRRCILCSLHVLDCLSSQEIGKRVEINDSSVNQSLSVKSCSVFVTGFHFSFCCSRGFTSLYITMSATILPEEGTDFISRRLYSLILKAKTARHELQETRDNTSKITEKSTLKKSNRSHFHYPFSSKGDYFVAEHCCLSLSALTSKILAVYAFSFPWTFPSFARICVITSVLPTSKLKCKLHSGKVVLSKKIVNSNLIVTWI